MTGFILFELIRDFHGVAHFGHRGLREGAAFGGAVHDDFVNALGISRQFLTARANRCEKSFERLEESLLDFDIADGAETIAILQILDLLFVRVEDVVVGENRVALDVAGSVGWMRLGSVNIDITRLRTTSVGSPR